MKKQLLISLLLFFSLSGFSQPWSLSQLQNVWHTRYMPSQTDLDSTWSCLWNKTTDGTPQLASATQSLYTNTFVTVTTNTVLANVSALTSTTLTSGSVYAFRAVLSYTATASAGGCKVSLSGSVTPTYLQYTVTKNAGQINTSSISQTQTALDVELPAQAVVGSIIINGTIKVNSAGTLLIKFAQTDANGTSYLYPGDSFIIRKL